MAKKVAEGLPVGVPEDDVSVGLRELNAQVMELEDRLSEKTTGMQLVEDEKKKLERENIALTLELEKALDPKKVAQDMDDLRKQLSERELQVAGLLKDVENLSKPGTTASGPDRCILAGRAYPVVKRMTAKTLALEDFRKRFVDEDHTVVVIDHHGG
jgi:uncharacterized protein YhaN